MIEGLHTEERPAIRQDMDRLLLHLGNFGEDETAQRLEADVLSSIAPDMVQPFAFSEPGSDSAPALEEVFGNELARELTEHFGNEDTVAEVVRARVARAAIENDEYWLVSKRAMRANRQDFEADALKLFMMETKRYRIPTRGEDLKMGQILTASNRAREVLSSQNGHLQRFKDLVSLGETVRTRLRFGNAGTVASVALYYYHRQRKGDYETPLPDLIQEGHIGLIKALDRYVYNPKNTVKFSTYARLWIRQEIGRAVGEDMMIYKPEHIVRQQYRVQKVRSQMAEENGGIDPTIDELAAKLGMGADELLYLLEISMQISIDNILSGDRTGLDVLSDYYNSNRLADADLRIMICQLFGQVFGDDEDAESRFSADQQLLLHRRFRENLTLEKIGSMFEEEVTKQEIARRLKLIIESANRAIAAAGLTKEEVFAKYR